MTTRHRTVARMLTAVLLAALAMPSSAWAAFDDNIPGVPIPPSPIIGALDDTYPAYDFDDVFAVRLGYNQKLAATMTADPATDFDLWLWKPGSTSVTDPSPWSHIAQSSQTKRISAESFYYPASQPGTYYVDVFGDPETLPNRGAYTLTWSVVQLASPTIQSKAQPTTCGYAGSSAVTGTVTLGGVPLKGARVLVQGRPAGTGTWKSLNYDTRAKPVVPRTVTNAAGRFSCGVGGITRKMEYRAIVWPSQTWGWTTGATVRVTPRAYLTRPRAPKRVVRNQRFRVRGDLKPRHAAGAKHVKITAYRKSKRTWRYAKSYNYHSYSRYTVKMSLPTRGTWKLVATTPADSQHLATTSSATVVYVR